MGNYTALKAAIDQVIKANGQEEITGPVLNDILKTMVNSLGAGYQFVGVATPATNPGTPDQNVVYLASEAGTYTNFGGVVLSEGLSLLMWNGSWSTQTFFTVDDEVSEGGTGIVTGDSVYRYGDNFPKIENDDNADLDILDDNGYVVARFKEGGFQTKKFDSTKTPNIIQGMDIIDLSLCDDNGNAIVVFQGGGIRTKDFNSNELVSMRYKGKKISIFGDSISTFGTPDSRNYDGTYCYSYYPTETCRYSELGDVTEGGVTYNSIKFNVLNTWWMRVIRKLGATLGINDSWRGSKVSGSATSSFCNQTRISHLGENGTPDVILVYAGTNDAGNAVTIGTFDTTPPPTTQEGIDALGSTTFAEAYRTMLIRLMFTYPFAEIVVILPTFTTSYYTIAELDQYVEVIKEACDFFGIKYIDARVTGINYYNKTSYLVDGIHPNAVGMQKLAEKVYKQLIFV